MNRGAVGTYPPFSEHIMRARRELDTAAKLAASHSMGLRANSWRHYSLVADHHTRWEIHPDDQIVRANPDVWPWTPELRTFLPSQRDWSLIDVVRAAIAAVGERKA